jgi:hypothetical protein
MRKTERDKEDDRHKAKKTRKQIYRMTMRQMRKGQREKGHRDKEINLECDKETKVG